MVDTSPDLDGLQKFLDEVPDEYITALQFSAAPWMHDPDTGTYIDPDKKQSKKVVSREELADECWTKLHANPQVNTAMRGKMGRLTGLGFETTSGISEIQDVIEETELDQRNRLYNYWPKYVVRSDVEGELCLSLTCHASGFIEVDFLEPGEIQGGGDEDTGIIFHPTKTTMPLFYNIKRNAYGKLSTRWKDAPTLENEQIPSIFIARYPELAALAKNHGDWDRSKQKGSTSRKKAFRKLGGYRRFIVAWDKSFITRRATSHLRTILEWLNHYDNLKKYEIDHKKSSGAYLWWFKISDPRTFRQWLKLSDADRRKTGILAKKTPGSSLITPPGIELQCINPKLQTITDQDADIQRQISSGLDEPMDITTGDPTGPFSSIKASRGPMTDRTSNEVAYFTRFLRHDFWGAIFFLKSRISDFPEFFEVSEARRFDPKKKSKTDMLPGDDEWESEPFFENVKKRPEMLVDFSFPISETVELESRARAILGVKHGPISETLGIPKQKLAELIGFGGYPRQRLRKATEDRNLPKLVYTMDAESLQEKAEAEPGKKKPADDKKTGDKVNKNVKGDRSIFTFRKTDRVDWEKVYKEGNAHWTEDLQPSKFAQDFAQELIDKKKKSILEIGCGNGRDSILFALAGLTVTSIDIVPEAIEIAKENMKKAGVDVDFQTGNVEKLIFDNNSFDSVFTLSVLHSTNTGKSVPEIFRILKNKGLLFIHLYSNVEKIDGTKDEFININEYIDLLKKNKFKLLDIYTTTEDEFDEVGEKHLVIVAKVQK